MEICKILAPELFVPSCDDAHSAPDEVVKQASRTGVWDFDDHVWTRNVNGKPQIIPGVGRVYKRNV